MHSAAASSTFGLNCVGPLTESEWESELEREREGERDAFLAQSTLNPQPFFETPNLP